MSSEGGDGHEQKSVRQEVVLDMDALYEAITHYMLERHGSPVVEIVWNIFPEEGHRMPPIRGIAARCFLE